ncbi:MAG: hypothetical protein J6S67_21030 [Methanobrevibacter sp.]|nr:hypothetical protein [Methanobrevibacter sp.]
MNNFEKIKAMDIDEMAELLHNYAQNLDDCIYCPIEYFCTAMCERQEAKPCINVMKLWLESEVRE